MEVDVNMSSSPEYQRWRSGVINKVDLESKGYWVAIEDGAASREVIIPIRSPDLWIRRATPAADGSSRNAGPPSASGAASADRPSNGSSPRASTGARSQPASPSAQRRTQSTASKSVAAGPLKSLSDCVSGIRVTDRQGRSGTVVSANGSMCTVKLDESGKESSYIFWMLRTEGSGSGPSGDSLVAGTYKCYSLAGATLNYMFMDVRIQSTTRYQDQDGRAGSYRLEAGGKIVFESGPFATANAKLLPGPKIGMNQNGGSFFNTSCSLQR